VLFHVTWEFIDTSETGSRRSLAVFANWQPPQGAEFKGHRSCRSRNRPRSRTSARLSQALARAYRTECDGDG
jgi:hypothetical protein